MYFLFLKSIYTRVFWKQFFSSLSYIKRGIMVVFQKSIMIVFLVIHFCYQQKYFWKPEYPWFPSQFFIARSLGQSHLHNGVSAKSQWNVYLATVRKNTWILEKHKELQGYSSGLHGSNFQTLKKDVIKGLRLKWSFHWELCLKYFYTFFLITRELLLKKTTKQGPAGFSRSCRYCCIAVFTPGWTDN